MLREVEEFLKELGDIANKHTNMYYSHDIDIPPTEVKSFEDAINKLKNRTDIICPINSKYAGLVKGALEHAEGETFEDVLWKLDPYIRRGQYIELLWMATCIFLAKDLEQLEKLAECRFILAPPGIYDLWERRKEELEKTGYRTFVCPDISLIDEYCNNLELKDYVVERAKDIAIKYFKKTYLHPKYRNAKYVIPACIFIAAITEGQPTLREKVASICKCRESTIRKWYGEICKELDIDIIDLIMT